MNQDRKKGVKLYASGGCVVVKNIWNTEKFSTDNSTRSAISGFSVRSGQRMRKYLRGCEAKYCSMLTLTYPGFYESNGKIVKEHLRKFMQSLKRLYNSSGQCHKGGFSAFWFLEFQERGAPHFHIFTNFLPEIKWVASRWYEVVGSEDERHLRAGTRTEVLKAGRGGTISYASKYAAKAAQKVAPEGYTNLGRFWGVYGNRTVVVADTVVRWDRAREVRGNLKKLRKLLTEARNSDKTIQHVDKPGTEVYFIANRAIFASIKREISIIECKMQHYSSIFADADIGDC